MGRLVGDLRRKEMDTLLEYLKPQVTSDNIQWLAERFPGRWKGIKSADEIKIWDRYVLIHLIHNILDAKKRRKAPYKRPILGLATQDLFQLTEMLTIEIPKKSTGWQLLNLILQKIKAH